MENLYIETAIGLAKLRNFPLTMLHILSLHILESQQFLFVFVRMQTILIWALDWIPMRH